MPIEQRGFCSYTVDKSEGDTEDGHVELSPFVSLSQSLLIFLLRRHGGGIVAVSC